MCILSYSCFFHAVFYLSLFSVSINSMFHRNLYRKHRLKAKSMLSADAHNRLRVSTVLDTASYRTGSAEPVLLFFRKGIEYYFVRFDYSLIIAPHSSSIGNGCSLSNLYFHVLISGRCRYDRRSSGPGGKRANSFVYTIPNNAVALSGAYRSFRQCDGFAVGLYTYFGRNGTDDFPCIGTES